MAQHKKISVTRMSSEHRKNIAQCIEFIGRVHNPWTVFSDFLAMTAITISNNSDPYHIAQLKNEDNGIQTALDNFFDIGLTGVVVFIDGELCGYAYGAPLSDDFFDAIVGKGDRNFLNIHRVLNLEFVKNCCQGYKYINYEEDLGFKGLRIRKTEDKPDFMIEKYIVTENE